MADDENAKWLFGGDSGERGEWEAHRRFISPGFNAIYRQGVVGPRHLKEAEFALFLQAARDGRQDASRQFEVWFQTDRHEGGDYGDVAMERIGARAHSFDVETAHGIVRVFADVMDDYYRARPKREMFIDTWQQSEAILRTFQKAIIDFRLGDIAAEIAASGNAISWMCSAIARDELWGHGFAGDRSKEDAALLLKRSEVEAFVSALIERVSALPTADILKLPRLGSVMYTLKESPWLKKAATEVIRRLTGPRATDATFLAFLEAMSGVVISSDRGAYYKISHSSIAGIMGEAELEKRWAKILKKRLSEDLTVKRTNIIKMMDEAKNW
ncbi:hypothetical protein [Brevundimonas vesicularis]|uniref:hypothetical protein n=1 Tax=Brevundimonas vesicularis TaxID=41276 RepID=UPI0038D40207